MTALLALAGGDRAAAQDEAAVRAQHRADCRLAKQILTKGQPAVRRDWALGIIGSCEGQEEVLAQLWQDPPESEEELERLFYLSREVRDGGIFRAALEVAESPSRPSRTRIAALGVMASYVDPVLILDFDGLEPLEGRGPVVKWDSVWGKGADLPVQEQGAPLPPDFEQTTRELAERLAESEEDSKVRAAAWWLVHGPLTR